MFLCDTIIVLNKRFVPDSRDSAYIYGVVQHALRAADLLKSEGAKVGFVLYDRDEQIAEPVLRELTILDSFPAVAVRFNFRMDPVMLTAAFRSASKLVATTWGSDPAQLPLLYYQTSVLLPYAPAEYNVAVTHHSPFVDHVAELLGSEAASRAFDWDHPKARHLLTMQTQALDVLAARDNFHCLEISALQERFLLRRGLPQRRVRRLPQPVEGAGAQKQLPEPLESLMAELRERGPGLAALTAVSRLDYFKNVDLFVAGCCLALRSGHLDRAIVVGGFSDDEERERLRGMVPADLAASFVFTPRIERGLLIGSLFPRLAGTGVFVCSSRFDLVPYTALESARAGLCTLVPDNGRVGAAEYLSDEYQFADSPSGLAMQLGRLAQDRHALGRFQKTASLIRQATSDGAFLRAFSDFCAQLR